MRPNIKIAAVIFMVAAAVAFVGCASPTISTPPPPQLTVAQANKALADADNTAVRAIIQLHAQGRVSDADQVAILGYCRVAAKLSTDVANIITSPDLWPTQRAALISAAVGASLPAIGSTSPTAAAVVAQVAILFDALKGQLGGLK